MTLNKSSEVELELRERNHDTPSASNPSLQGERFILSVAHVTERGMPRSLNQRHVRMIGIAGTIGVGLFLGSGRALAVAGPAGSLAAYILVATIAVSTMRSVGEMTIFASCRFFSILCTYILAFAAERWFDPALGFTVGWTYWLSNALAIPAEISAAVVVLDYWQVLSVAASSGATIAFVIAIFISNVVAVRYFGEVETFFSSTKILLILGFLFGGIIINARGNIGFEYWRNPGCWSGPGLDEKVWADRLLGFVAATMQAAFSFKGMELMVIAAAETKNPRKNIALAVNRINTRIAIFYILGILIVGILVPHDDPALLKDVGTGAQSPFVIAFSKFKALPDIINGIIFMSALLAGNTLLFAGARVLYGLAVRQQAFRFIPKLTGKSTGESTKLIGEPTNKHVLDMIRGVPVRALLLTWIFSFLAFINVKYGSQQALSLLSSLTTSSCFGMWFAMNLTYIQFYRGLQRQKRRPQDNQFHSVLQPYLAYWGLFWSLFLMIANGYPLMGDHPNKKTLGKDFAVAYTAPILFLVLYFGYKFQNRIPYLGARFNLEGTSIVKYDDMDFEKIDIPDDSVPERWWETAIAWVF